MEKYTLEHDMNVMYVTASSFPEGIMDAFDRLRKQVTITEKRPFFGISKPGIDGVIVYKAGVLETEAGEAEKYGCTRFTIEKGTYMIENIGNWKENIPAIGHTFQKLIALPELDPSAHCIERYNESGDVMCMVKIVD